MGCLDVDTENKSTEPTKQEAYVHSWGCVNTILANPGSADYPYLPDEEIERFDDSTFRIVSHVNSQNDFGAVKTILYRIDVVFDSTGKMRCDNFIYKER